MAMGKSKRGIVLAGENIVITGCLRGIGRETLRAFAEQGANVFACAYAPEEEFVAFCEELAEKNHVRVIPIYFDLSDNAAVAEAAKTIQNEKMKIHGLVNIAGIYHDAPFGKISYQDMLDTFQVNVFSQILFSQYVADLMLQDEAGGSIVFTTDIIAMDGNDGQTVYGASRAALVGAMKSMAVELGKSGIRVNVVAPGFIKSPMTDKLAQDVIDRKISRMEIPRFGDANEVAQLYLFLMSDLSSHVTGQIIRIDGGIG